MVLLFLRRSLSALFCRNCHNLLNLNCSLIHLFVSCILTSCCPHRAVHDRKKPGSCCLGSAIEMMALRCGSRRLGAKWALWVLKRKGPRLTLSNWLRAGGCICAGIQKVIEFCHRETRREVERWKKWTVVGKHVAEKWNGRKSVPFYDTSRIFVIHNKNI